MNTKPILEEYLKQKKLVERLEDEINHFNIKICRTFFWS